MIKRNAPQAVTLRQKLAIQRTMTSLLERELLSNSDQIAFEHEDWVKAFIDYGHADSFDGGETTAFRAITVPDGDLFWLVRRTGKDRGYHSAQPNPLNAIDEARAAWPRRSLVRKNWDNVERLPQDLILGRTSLRVRIEDAHASPLCTMGITWFLRRLRMPRVTEISGRMAALLMKLDLQVGFVIYEAHLRDANANETSALKDAGSDAHICSRRALISA